MLDATKPAEPNFPACQSRCNTYGHDDNRAPITIGALLVVVGHMYYTYFGKPGDWFSWLSGIQHGAFLGVAIFFVISGYLVTQSRWRSSSYRGLCMEAGAEDFAPSAPSACWCSRIVVYPFTSLSLVDYVFSKDMLGFLLNIFIFPYNNCVAPIAAGYVTGCNLLGATWSLIFEVLLYVMVGAIGLTSRTVLNLEFSRSHSSLS